MAACAVVAVGDGGAGHDRSITSPMLGDGAEKILIYWRGIFGASARLRSETESTALEFVL